jgi:rare lipoprotein A (peptidoglycan hydrolase)
MRHSLTKTALLALLAAPSALACSAQDALAAGPGGVAVSPAPAPGLRPAASHGASLATWFGPGFYGKQTACGQTLTPLTLGVAHRTLPCGTLVTVSYRGRRATLPVIDRGPYANGANWDLTTQAARVLGIVATARIATRVVGSVRNTPALGQPPAPPPVPVLASTGGSSAG